MTEYVFAKPREGGRVRRAEQENAFRPMRDEGEHVPCIDYYNRLIISGDLIVCDPPAASSHEIQGTGYDPGAVGHELQGRAATPNTEPKPEPAQAKPSRSTKEH